MSYEYVETNQGLLVKPIPRLGVDLTNYWCNREVQFEPAMNGWFLARGQTKLSTISIIQKTQAISGYVKSDLLNDKYPDLISPSEFSGLKDPNIQQFYTAVYDKSTDVWRDLDISAVVKLYESMVVLPDDPYKFHPNLKEVISPKEISYERWVEFVPSFAWPEYPCFISSSTTYKIIRNHVLANIDNRFARVSSNYDFCFAVEKKVKLASPWQSNRETFNSKGRSYSPPRITTTTIDFKTYTIFSMTHAAANYKGYTSIEPFKGNNVKDLLDTVQEYLDDLMRIINSPFQECTHCKGSGHEIVLVTPAEMNKR